MCAFEGGAKGSSTPVGQLGWRASCTPDLTYAYRSRRAHRALGLRPAECQSRCGERDSREARRVREPAARDAFGAHEGDAGGAGPCGPADDDAPAPDHDGSACVFDRAADRAVAFCNSAAVVDDAARADAAARFGASLGLSRRAGVDGRCLVWLARCADADADAGADADADADAGVLAIRFECSARGGAFDCAGHESGLAGPVIVVVSRRLAGAVGRSAFLCDRIDGAHGHDGDEPLLHCWRARTGSGSACRGGSARRSGPSDRECRADAGGRPGSRSRRAGGRAGGCCCSSRSCTSARRISSRTTPGRSGSGRAGCSGANRSGRSADLCDDAGISEEARRRCAVRRDAPAAARDCGQLKLR